jgi:1,4-dihydroxy-2-naphthoyl-CoA hydrolase
MNEKKDMIKLIEAHSSTTTIGAMGIKIQSYDNDSVTLYMDIDQRHLQYRGFLHGGVSVLLAETCASFAASFAVGDLDYSIFGMEINANHVKAVREGRIFAKSKPYHRGKYTHVYGVEITNQNGELICISRCTIAVKK